MFQRHLTSCPRDESGGLTPHRCRGLWGYHLNAEREQDGKRRQLTRSGFPTKAAAKAALRNTLEAERLGIHAQGLSVAAYLDVWLASKHSLKPKTVSAYRDAINLYLRPGLGSVQLDALQPQHLDRFYASIRVGRRGHELSPSSIRRVHAVLRSALNSAVKRRYIATSPTAHIELAPEEPKRPQPWKLDEVRRFLSDGQSDPLAPLYYLMLVTGLRRGEALGLRWTDVDLDAGKLRVVQQRTEVRGASVLGTPKSRRSRRILPLDEATITMLRKHQADQDAVRTTGVGAWLETGHVFTMPDGRLIRPEFATRNFQRLAAKLGLPVIRLHDLRHTNASLALDAGIDLKVVSERLGHATTAITADLYTHVSGSVARDAADRLGRLLEPPVNGC